MKKISSLYRKWTNFQHFIERTDSQDFKLYKGKIVSWIVQFRCCLQIRGWVAIATFGLAKWSKWNAINWSSKETIACIRMNGGQGRGRRQVAMDCKKKQFNFRRWDVGFSSPSGIQHTTRSARIDLYTESCIDVSVRKYATNALTYIFHEFTIRGQSLTSF